MIHNLWIIRLSDFIRILALAIAYAIVKGTKWFLKVRRIKKFVETNFVPYDLLKYTNKENNAQIKQK